MFPPSTQVLIVDHMVTMRKIVKNACRKLGFGNMTEASDGDEAWGILNSANPAFGLVISDWNMPNCTGIELLKMVRADARFASLPFILLTAETDKTQITEAIQNKVSGYVVKPFTLEVLRKQLEAVHRRVGGGR